MSLRMLPFKRLGLGLAPAALDWVLGAVKSIRRVTVASRIGDERCGFLRAGECKFVLMGDRLLGMA